MLMDQHRMNLEKVIDDVRFEMVDKHHRHPKIDERKKWKSLREESYRLGKVLLG